MPSRRPPSPVRRTVIALAAGVAGACATQSPEPAPAPPPPGSDLVHVYRCGERRVEATPEGDGLRLAVDGAKHRLARVPAASGARWEGETDGGRLAFWDRGDVARLETKGEAAACTRVAVRDAAGPLPFRARGNEPGWHLEIAPLRMTLVTDYGARHVETLRPPPTTTPDGHRYEAATPGHALAVEIERRLCRDDMSGMPYPRAVVVALDERRLRGCGGDPAALLTGDPWTVERLAGEAASDPPPTLRFGEDGSLAGSTSCNRYTTRYALTGETLTTEAIATTRRACAPERMAQESRFTALLGAVRRFDLAPDGALVLETGAGETIRARRRP